MTMHQGMSSGALWFQPLPTFSAVYRLQGMLY